MAQQVLVDLDLNGNLIHEVGDAVADGDAVNKGQLDTAVASITTDISDLDSAKADKTVTVTAGDGLTGGGSLAGPDVPLSVLLDPAADNTLVFGPTGAGLYVPPPGAVTVPVQDVEGTAPIVVTDAAGVFMVAIDQAAMDTAKAYIDDADTALQASIDAEETARTDADALKADKVVTVTPGLGLQGGGTLAGPDIPLSVLLDPAADNALTVGPTGLYVQTPAAVDFPVDDVLGTTSEITVVEATDVFTVGIDPAYTAARSAEVVAGDTAIDARIDGLSITGAGSVSVDEPDVDQWVISVDSLQLANTYVGPGDDDATINDDILPAVAEAGDLYINNVDGRAFICSSTAAATWVELAAAPAGITSITSPDNSINVVVDGPPTASLQVSAALQSAIATATAINIAQDSSIAVLSAASHDEATGSGAIAVDSSQGISLTLASPELSQSIAGLAVDLSAYATGADLADYALTATVDADNAVQDAAIADLQAASHDAATSGSGAIGVTGQAISLVIDPASDPSLEQTATGLKLTVAAGIQKKVGTVTVAGGVGTFTHGLGTSDVVVSVKSGGCHITAAVCDNLLDAANVVDIEAADGDYDVIVIG